MRSFGRLVVGASQSKLDVKVTAYLGVFEPTEPRRSFTSSNSSPEGAAASDSKSPRFFSQQPLRGS